MFKKDNPKKENKKGGSNKTTTKVSPMRKYFKDVMMNPVYFKAYLDSYIINQEEAKKILSITFYEHFKSIHNPNLDNSTTFLVGASGTGKSYLVTKLAELIDLPFVCYDLNIISPYGYKGVTLVEVLESLYHASEKYVIKERGFDEYSSLSLESKRALVKSKMEHGVIFLDEADKVALLKEGPAQYAIAVQYELLKYIEGSDIVIFKKDDDEGITISTKGILFLFAGAFSNLHPTKNRKQTKKTKKTIGFTMDKPVEYNDSEPENTKPKKITQEDIRNSGIIRELSGRITKLANFYPLSKDDLYSILKKAKNSLIDQQKIMFELDNIELIFDDEALKELADMAYEKNLGARSLKSSLEEAMLKLKFICPSHNELTKVTITKAGIHDYTHNIYEDAKGNKVDIDDYDIENIQSID